MAGFANVALVADTRTSQRARQRGPRARPRRPAPRPRSRSPAGRRRRPRSQRRRRQRAIAAPGAPEVADSHRIPSPRDARLRVRLSPPDEPGPRPGGRQDRRHGRPPPGLAFARTYRRLLVAFVAHHPGRLDRRHPAAAGLPQHHRPPRHPPRASDGLDRLALLALVARLRRRRPQHPPALAVGPHRRGADLRPALGPLRPRAGHAAGVLHPHPDRLAHQPHEQRRHGRPAGVHRHARAASCRTSSTSP